MMLILIGQIEFVGGSDEKDEQDSQADLSFPEHDGEVRKKETGTVRRREAFSCKCDDHVSPKQG